MIKLIVFWKTSPWASLSMLLEKDNILSNYILKLRIYFRKTSLSNSYKQSQKLTNCSEVIEK